MNSLPQPEGENLTGRPNAKPILWSMVLMVVLCFLIPLIDRAANNRQVNPFIPNDLLIAVAYGLAVGLVVQSKCLSALKMLMAGLGCWAIMSMMYMLCFRYHDLANPSTASNHINFAVNVAVYPFYIGAVLLSYFAKPRKPRSFGTLAITVYMCLVIGTANQSQATGAAQFQGSGQLQSSGQTNVVSHITTECLLLFLLLLIVTLAVWGVWEICKAAHLCGGTGSTPPASPPGKGGDNDNVVMGGTGKITSKDETSVAPVNYPGMFTGTTSPLLSDATNSISVWNVTNLVSDPYMDVGYPFVELINYSLLGTTNMHDWYTICTVVQWQTSDQVNPAFCEIIYTNQVTSTGIKTVTNGYPIGTNWFQVNLNAPAAWGGIPTNTAVYGNGVMCQAPAGGKNKPHEFYRLYSNTNAIVTTGPF